MNPEVQVAVDEVRRQFAGHDLLVAGDPHGGAWVIVEDVLLGPPYAQSTTWVGFHVVHTCPYADTYPHFVRGDLSRLDGTPLGEGMVGSQVFPSDPSSGPLVSMPARPAVQVSRRSNHRDDVGLETPNIKLLKVLQWIRAR